MLPWVLLIGFWFFMIRRMQGGSGGVGGIFKLEKVGLLYGPLINLE